MIQTYTKFHFFIFLLLVATYVKAQEAPVTQVAYKSKSISLELLGLPAWPVGINYSQMLSNKISMEVGVGAMSLGLGAKMFFKEPQIRKINYYVGISGSMNYDGFPMFYVPIGASYTTKGNFEYSFDAGIMGTNDDSLMDEGGLSPWVGIKIGRRFGESKGSTFFINETASKPLEYTKDNNIISVSMQALDPVFAVTYERLFSPYVSGEVTLGFIGYGIGANLYLPGLRYNKVEFKTGVKYGGGYVFGEAVYIPIGINYFSNNGLVFSFDLGPRFELDYNDVMIGFSLRIGKAF